MTVLTKPTPAQQWQAMRLLRLLYVRLAREFAITAPPCEELDTGIDLPSQEDMALAHAWFQKMDDLIQVFQLRQFLQTTTGVNEDTLIALVKHFVAKLQHNDSDRDKVDFLLVQFLTQTSPSQMEEDAISTAFVAVGLEPMLGKVGLTVPAWLSPAEGLLEKAQACHTLNELFSSGVLEAGRKIKIDAGEKYFAPPALVAFTRFNFRLRRVFFRLMHQDINAILDGLHHLEASGVGTLDCTAAQFSNEEPTAQLRMICQSWKIMFQAEYSSGQPMRVLADLRGIVDTALQAKQPASSSALPVPRANAAAASAQGAPHLPELEVSGDS
jgi:hypothetical protein